MGNAQKTMTIYDIKPKLSRRRDCQFNIAPPHSLLLYLYNGARKKKVMQINAQII